MCSTAQPSTQGTAGRHHRSAVVAARFHRAYEP